MDLARKTFKAINHLKKQMCDATEFHIKVIFFKEHQNE